MKWRPKVVLVLLSVAAMIAAAQSLPDDQRGLQTQARGYWIDTSKLMWAAKDNGKDVSWRGAMKYCRNLRLAGYSDWRLANMAELQGIYDKNVKAPGLAGFMKKQRAFTWHVEGNLFLTGNEWSGHRILNGHMPLESYEYHFDFNEGRADDDPSGWPYSSVGMRALCVRRSGQ